MKQFLIIFTFVVLPLTIYALKSKSPEQRIRECFGEVETQEIAKIPGKKLFPESPDLRGDRYFRVKTENGEEFIVRNGPFGLDIKPAN